MTDGHREQIREHFPEENIPAGRLGRKPASTRFVLEAVLGVWNCTLPPRSPKMNTRVEYAHGTARREFWAHIKSGVNFTVKEIEPLMQVWQEVYNSVRPHENLDMMTPLEHIARYHAGEA